MLVTFGLVGAILALAEGLAEIPRELILVVFWFAADTLCDYVMLTGHDLRMDRKLAGRLASIKVVFSNSYEDKDYTEGDVEKLYSEIEEDVNRTLRE